MINLFSRIPPAHTSRVCWMPKIIDSLLSLKKVFFIYKNKFWVLTSFVRSLLVLEWLELNRSLLWKVVACWLVAVFVSQEGDCVDLTVGGGPRDGSANDEMFFGGAGVLHFGGLASRHSIAGFVTEIWFFVVNNAIPYSSSVFLTRNCIHRFRCCRFRISRFGHSLSHPMARPKQRRQGRQKRVTVGVNIFIIINDPKLLLRRRDAMSFVSR